jgi:hypothetical protein
LGMTIWTGYELQADPWAPIGQPLGALDRTNTIWAVSPPGSP